MNPFPGRQVVVRVTGKKKPEPVQIDKNNDECLVFSTITGNKYISEAIYLYINGLLHFVRNDGVDYRTFYTASY